MTDEEIAAAYGAVKQLELAARTDSAEAPEALVVFRQAVALRRALGNWIVGRATPAQPTATR